MRRMVPLIILLFLCVQASGKASECSQHPVDPNASLLCSLEVTVALSPTPPMQGLSVSQVIHDICVWRTSTGRVDYVVKTESIRFVGNCADADSISTADLFDLLAQADISQGIALGYTPCGVPCSESETTRVYADACVQRVGSGCTTQFIACAGSGYCSRRYSVCCPNGPGSPVLNLLSIDAPACAGSGCESACQ